MTRPALNLAAVRPWWLRLFILAMLGHPLVASRVLHGQLHKEHLFFDIGNWTTYALFIWMFVGLCVGLKRLLDWLSIAAIFALTVLLTGAILRKTGLWSLIERTVGTTTTDPTQSLIDLLFRFFMILAATPFAMLVIESFPASDLMRWVSRRGATHTARVVLVAAMFLRMFQHVGEVVTRCMVAWREENPSVILPRYRGDWVGSIFRKLGVLEWIKVSVSSWCAAIAVQSLAAIPTVVRDFRRVQSGWKTSPGGLQLR
jgi:hypothetical protein